MPRVVITGIGLITSLGLDRGSTWEALRRGESGATRLDIPGLESGHAGFPIRWPSPMGTGADPALEILVRAADEAMLDAGILAPGEARGSIQRPPPLHPTLPRDGRGLSFGSLTFLETGPSSSSLPPCGGGPGRGVASNQPIAPGLDPDRIATLIGLSKGGVRGLTRALAMIRSGATDEETLAGLWMRSWPSSGASLLASRYGFRGPCVAPVAACATGLVAALQGADLIRRGACDLAVVGGADASLEPILLAAFRRMKALARVDEDPKLAVRPWDKARSGFLVGEGGAVLVLERLDHAIARGATPYAELVGGALGSDAYHETALDPDPAGLARVITRALLDAGVEPSGVDAVNVHGTATLANDPLECRSIRLAFGPEADRLACSANKGQIGHLLGAAGSAELAIAALSVRDGYAPPTLNLDRPDEGCDLDGSPGQGRSLPIRNLLKLSLGFGGHFAAAVLRRI